MNAIDVHHYEALGNEVYAIMEDGSEVVIMSFESGGNTTASEAAAEMAQSLNERDANG